MGIQKYKFSQWMGRMFHRVNSTASGARAPRVARASVIIILFYFSGNIPASAQKSSVLYCYSFMRTPLQKMMHWNNYRQISNIRRTLIGNKIVDHSDVVGTSPVGAAPTTFSLSAQHHGFNGLGKDRCKTRLETFRFWYLVRLILEVLR